MTTLIVRGQDPLRDHSASAVVVNVCSGMWAGTWFPTPRSVDLTWSQLLIAVYQMQQVKFISPGFFIFYHKHWLVICDPAPNMIFTANILFLHSFLSEIYKCFQTQQTCLVLMVGLGANNNNSLSSLKPLVACDVDTTTSGDLIYKKKNFFSLLYYIDHNNVIDMWPRDGPIDRRSLRLRGRCGPAHGEGRWRHSQEYQ